MTVLPAPRTPRPRSPRRGRGFLLTPSSESTQSPLFPKEEEKKSEQCRRSLNFDLACVAMAFLARLSALAGTVEADVCEMKAAGMTVKTCCVSVRSHAIVVPAARGCVPLRPHWRG